MLQIQTDVFVYLVDSDMSPSKEAYADMKTGNLRSHLLEMRKAWLEKKEIRVFVVPTFERTEVALLNGTQIASEQLTPEQQKAACIGKDANCWIYENYDIPRTKDKVLEMIDTGAIIPFYWSRVCPLTYSLCKVVKSSRILFPVQHQT